MEMHNPSLDALEKRAYRTVVDHGFFDLLLAAAIVVLTLVFVLSKWFVLALFPIVLFKTWAQAAFNREIVEPRIGHVRLAPSRLDQISTARKTSAGVLFVLAFIVARLGDWPPLSTIAPLAWLSNTPQVYMAVIAGAATGVTGWLFGLPRFIAYGFLVVAAPSMAVVAGMPAGTGWATASLIILITGCGLLIRFLRENPVDGG